MKVYDTDQIRNVALIGQRGCGKTSLADAMAFSSGITNRLGKVDDGTSLSDFTEDEISRKTSIGLSILTCPWKNVKINLLDLPGHPDFIGELITGVNVAETAIIILNGNTGIEVGTEIQYKYVEKFNLPRMFFINKIEKDNVKTSDIIAQLQQAYGLKAAPMQLPIGEGAEYKGVVDLLRMKGVTFDASGKLTEGDIPANLKDQAEEAHQKLIEAVAEADDALLEKFFDKGELSPEEILSGLKKAIVDRSIYPILFGSADLNSGVQSLLNFIADYLPSPDEAPTQNLLNEGTDEVVGVDIKNDANPLAYVFKTIAEAHIGEISLFKVLGGKISQGLDLYNANQRNNERVGQVYSISGKERKELDSANAGDIAATVKLKSTKMGETLGKKGDDLVVPPIDYPEPVMDTGIRPKSKGDEEKLSTSLHKLHDEDPSFKMVIDPELRQTVLFTQGSTQTEILNAKLKAKFGVEIDVFKPRIPYRETIKGKTEIQYKYKKQSGGRGQYGDVHLRIEPNPRGEGFTFANEISGGVIPSKFIPSIEKGLVEALLEGGLSKSPVVDVKVAVFYGSYHTVDSSDMAFKLAALMGFREGYLKCKPILLEPIYNVEIIVPEEFTGDIMGDMSSRRGKISGMDPEGRYQKVRGAVPLAELYNYTVDLRSMTSGQAYYTREFSHYEELPREITEKVTEEIKKSKEE